MSIPDNLPPRQRPSRDAANWAQMDGPVHGTSTPGGVRNRMEGRQITGPMRGFGQLWQKTYSLLLDVVAITPQELIQGWKENFPQFWPPGNSFYRPITGIAPGETALMDLGVPGTGLKLSTGIMVLYADEEQFTFITPEGHMLAGWITFSAYERGGHTVVQVQVLIRASDPLLEIALRLGGHRQEDRFWRQTLSNVAAHFGVEGQPETRVVCLDRRVLWSNARNIRYNPVAATLGYTLATPLRWLRNRKQVRR